MGAFYFLDTSRLLLFLMFIFCFVMLHSNHLLLISLLHISHFLLLLSISVAIPISIDNPIPLPPQNQTSQTPKLRILIDKLIFLSTFYFKLVNSCSYWMDLADTKEIL